MFGRRLFRVMLVLLVLSLLLAATAPGVRAFETRDGDRVVVSADEVVQEDLYVSAATFILDGTIQGDLVVFAGEAEINGTVEGDLIVIAGSTIVSGAIGDDVIVAGGATLLEREAIVSDDVIATGYSLEAADTSRVEGTVIYAGYQALLAGAVAEDARLTAAGVRVAGQVGGDLVATVGDGGGFRFFDPLSFLPGRIRVPNVAPGLELTADARIDGDLRYTAAEPAMIRPGQVGGQVVQRMPEGAEPEVTPVVAPLLAVLGWLLDQVRRLVTLLVVGLLLVWLWPGLIRSLAARLEANPWGSLGWGVLTLVAVPAAVLVFLGLVALLAVILGIITLGGLAFYLVALGLSIAGIVLVVFGLTVAYLSKIVVAYWLGRYLLERGSTGIGQSVVGPFIVGLVIVVVVTAIPILGWLVNLVVTLFGLGTLWLLWEHRRRGTE